MFPETTKVLKQLSERLTLVEHQGHAVLIVNYGNAKEKMMIDAFNDAKDFVMKRGQQISVVSLFNNNFVTPKFVRHLESELAEAEPFIKRNAVVGLTEVQVWILKGINLWSGKKINNVSTVHAALDLVTSDIE